MANPPISETIMAIIGTIIVKKIKIANKFTDIVPRFTLKISNFATDLVFTHLIIELINIMSNFFIYFIY